MVTNAVLLRVTNEVLSDVGCVWGGGGGSVV
jgi:hypothetical protein